MEVKDQVTSGLFENTKGGALLVSWRWHRGLFCIQIDQIQRSKSKGMYNSL